MATRTTSPRVADRLASHPAYSYASDPAVPAFPDDASVIVYDGVCVLCSHAMRIIATRDRRARYRYVSAQSPLGQALFRHYGLDAANFETVLLIEQGRGYGKLDMARRVAAEIGGPYRGVAVFGLLPGRIQDWCYDLVAQNRYRLFGRRDVCIAPDASWRTRVIELK
jgi:predicted DCC family thiol-disulfide oxidoreductase YuxK